MAREREPCRLAIWRPRRDRLTTRSNTTDRLVPLPGVGPSRAMSTGNRRRRGPPPQARPALAGPAEPAGQAWTAAIQSLITLANSSGGIGGCTRLRRRTVGSHRQPVRRDRVCADDLAWPVESGRPRCPHRRGKYDDDEGCDCRPRPAATAQAISCGLAHAGATIIDLSQERSSVEVHKSSRNRARQVRPDQ